MKIGDDSAVVMVRRLEAGPLDEGAAALRRTLFEWLVLSDRLQEFDAATWPIDELDRSEYPYKEELMMQFLFGGAAWVIGNEASFDRIAQYESGIRSLLSAYRNIIQKEHELRDRFLDRLDELRRLGELRTYILQKKRVE